MKPSEIPICEKCGKQHERGGNPTCAAHNALGQPCGIYPLRGATVCRRHGGSAPQVRAKAERVKARIFVEGRIAQLLRECEVENQHPMDGLLEVVRHAGAMFRLLAGMVGELDVLPGTSIIGVNEDGSPAVKNIGFTGYNHLGEEVPAILVQMYGLWADRYARACKLALDAGIDERMVRNAEMTSMIFFDAITAAIRDAQLTPEQTTVMRRSLAERLRTVSAPGMLPE